jgi:hypothetical protein
VPAKARACLAQREGLWCEVFLTYSRSLRRSWPWSFVTQAIRLLLKAPERTFEMLLWAVIELRLARVWEVLETETGGASGISRLSDLGQGHP